MTNPQNTADARERAVRDWERQTDHAERLDRRFSGERVKRIMKGDWLSKVGFVVGTAAILFFALTHDSKQKGYAGTKLARRPWRMNRRCAISGHR